MCQEATQLSIDGVGAIHNYQQFNKHIKAKGCVIADPIDEYMYFTNNKEFQCIYIPMGQEAVLSEITKLNIFSSSTHKDTINPTYQDI